MPAAARLADSIGHSPSMNWLLAGLLAGAAIAVAGVAIVGTGGLAAVAIVGGAAAGGAGLGEVMSTMSWAPKEVSGMIVGACSANVFTNALPAARAHVDMVTCGAHAGPPIPISTGSGQVFINGMPAARVDDKTSCGAVITTGSGNVFIGGGAVRTDIISSEDLVPAWVHAALLVVGAGAALVLAGPAIAVGGLVVGMAGAYAAAWAGAKAFGEGSDGQKWSAIAGGFVGGWLGAKGAPGAWNFAKRIESAPMSGLGSANGANNPARALQLEEFIAPSTGKRIQAAVDGKAVVPIDKVSIFARGGVADVSQELSALRDLKQSNRKLFDADPRNIDRLDRLKSMHRNYDRSKAMSRELDKVGLADSSVNNKTLINHLLETGKSVSPENRVWLPSLLEGPNGALQVRSTWVIMDDNRAYLSTLMFVPVK